MGAAVTEVLVRRAPRGPPAHASLRFDGGQGPGRDAILEVVAEAPINSDTLHRGPQIEAFVKLPEPFEGEHAWMGLLSWQGRNGDAGKTTGWSPLEPTCSLDLSPERFPQYVVYPALQDADLSTSTVSRIVCNPTQPSPGIATLGRPFVTGATQVVRPSR